MKKLLPLMAMLLSAPAMAATQTYEGMARPWQLGFQEPGSPVMERLAGLHDNVLLVMCVGISLFVLALTLYICVRFSRKNNPVPSKTAHNTKLEIIWTTIPILILIGLAIPSLKLHYFMQKTADTELTVKVTGYQWYWGYEYPDNGGFGYESRILADKDLKPGQHRLLDVDNRLVVPVDTKVKLLLTGQDVIHSFALPAFGIKRDAVPGRLNETWFQATQTGTYYGQCSELCGVNHGFMPIAIDVVSKENFAKWVAAKKKDAGIVDAKPEAKTDAKTTTASKK